MTLEISAATGRIHPGIADAPEQQQRAGQRRDQVIERFAAGDVKHGAKHPEGARIAGGAQDRFHQLLIHIGAVHVHLVEGAADRGGAAQVFEQEPLQQRTLDQGATEGAPGDRSPAAGRSLLLAERPGSIEQHHPGRLIA